MRLYVTLLISSFLWLGGDLNERTASAEANLKGRIYLTQKGVSRKLSEKALLKFARRNHAKALKESGDGPLKERYWPVSMVLNLNRPIGDMEFQILFYDTQNGRKYLGMPMTIFVNDRSQKTFVHRLRLKRKDFPANHRMEMVVTVRNREVARRSFQLLGEAKAHNGIIDFSENETK